MAPTIRLATARKSVLQSAPDSGCREDSHSQPKQTLPHLGDPPSDKQRLMQTSLPHTPSLRAICLEALGGEERSLAAKMSCYPIFASCNVILMGLGRSDYPGTFKGKLLLKPDSSFPDNLKEISLQWCAFLDFIPFSLVVVLFFQRVDRTLKWILTRKGPPQGMHAWVPLCHTCLDNPTFILSIIHSFNKNALRI